MSKSKYYIKVKTYSSTSKLGEIVAKQVWTKYNKSVITSGREVERIIAFIRKAQDEATAENPNLKRMFIERLTGEKFFAIYLVNDANRKIAFDLTGEMIEHEYCEEGGEL